MVCPLRFVLAILSVTLLAWSAFALLVDKETADALFARMFRKRGERSWWRFAVAFFTGEILYNAAGWSWGAAEQEAADAGACLPSGGAAGDSCKAAADAGPQATADADLAEPSGSR